MNLWAFLMDIGFLPELFAFASGFASSQIVDVLQARRKRRDAMTQVVAAVSILLPELRALSNTYERNVTQGVDGAAVYFGSVHAIAPAYDDQAIRNTLAGASGLPSTCHAEWLRVGTDLDALRTQHQALRGTVRLQPLDATKAESYRRNLSSMTANVGKALKSSRPYADSDTRRHVDSLIAGWNDGTI